jgi:hypothetical protein
VAQVVEHLPSKYEFNPQYHQKKKKSKKQKTWGCGSSDRVSAYQAQGPEFKLKYQQEKKSKQST